jgi:hypothetical protein
MNATNLKNILRDVFIYCEVRPLLRAGYSLLQCNQDRGRDSSYAGVSGGSHLEENQIGTERRLVLDE